MCGPELRTPLHTFSEGLRGRPRLRRSPVLGGGGVKECYPVPAAGSSLSSLWLSLLQTTIGKGVFVETVGTKRANSTTLLEVPTGFPPTGSRRGNEGQECSGRVEPCGLWGDMSPLDTATIGHVSKTRFWTPRPKPAPLTTQQVVGCIGGYRGRAFDNTGVRLNCTGGQNSKHTLGRGANRINIERAHRQEMF